MKRTPLVRKTALAASSRARAAGNATSVESGRAAPLQRARLRSAGSSSGTSSRPGASSDDARGTVRASNAPGLALPKGQRPSGQQRRDRDRRIYRSIRAAVMRDDGDCRFPEAGRAARPCAPHAHECAHMAGRKRAETRGRPPEYRHDARFLIRLCRWHHEAYDGALGTGRGIDIRPLTMAGGRGVCEFVDFRTGESIGVS